MILATHRDGVKKVLGRSNKLSRPWIGSKTPEKKQRSEEYSAKNNKVKWSARKDTRN